MKIPFFRYPFVFEQHQEDVTLAMMKTVRSGGFILQEELRIFEEQLAEFCRVSNAVGVGNATDGIELILRAVGIQPGDEIIVCAHTFVATAGAIKAVGAEPVFAEAGWDHLLDPGDIEARVTEKTRAVMPTQLNGRTAEMNELQEIADRHGLIVLEDSAQGLGSLYRGRMAGTFAPAGVFSFYPAKTLGGLGDGGAVITSDEGLADTLRELRDHGRNPETGEVMRWGRNSRLDNLQAAVLTVKLDRIEEDVDRRREIAGRYDENLRHLGSLVLPPPPAPRDSEHFDSFQNYEIEADDRDALRAHLAENGVGSILQWGGKAVHEFSALNLDTSLPRTEEMMRRSLLLPMNCSLTDEEVDYISEQIIRFYETR